MTFSGPVVHNNAAFSEPPWTVMGAIVASTGYPLVASRFTFTINQSEVQNYATLTLAPNATEEQQVLLAGQLGRAYGEPSTSEGRRPGRGRLAHGPANPLERLGQVKRPIG